MTAYSTESLNKIYELLFCDNAELYSNDTADKGVYPWNTLLDPETTDQGLEQLVKDSSVEARIRAVAANILLKRGVPYGEQVLFGVVIEVGLDEGLDTLAAYDDGTARYINYSEKLIVWDTDTVESRKFVDDLFAASRNVVAQIGPWERERLPPPVTGNIRLSFIVSDGLYFGEGSMATLSADPMGGSVINAGVALMNFLIEKSMGQSA